MCIRDRLKGTCTAIWSPSKSALNAAHVKGWSSIASPSINLGSKAWTPSLCSVGALFNNTGCSLTNNSSASQTAFVSFSTNFLVSSISCCLFSGITKSSFPKEIPALNACLNPRSFNLSQKITVVFCPQNLNTMSITSEQLF